MGWATVAAVVVLALVLVFSPISPFNNGKNGGLLGLITDTADQLQQWIGQQLLAIANDHLGPELAFERIDYRPPGTVELTNVTLDSGTTRLLSAKQLIVTLAETPKRGQPIQIKSVSLVEPEINIVQSESGGIAGFDNLVKSTGGRTLEDGGSTRLSDVFRIETISIDDGTVSYQRPDQPLMRLDEITTSLKVAKAGEVPDTTGAWYTLLWDMDREPLASLSMNGKFNLDTLALALDEFALNIALSPGQYEMLPPSFQVMLNEYKMRGELKARGKGTVQLTDFDASDLAVDCELADAHMVFGEYQVPIKTGTMQTELRDSIVSIASSRFEAFDGIIELNGSLGLTDKQPYAVRVKATNADIEKLMATTDGTQRMKGLLTADCNAAGDLATTEGSEELHGDGNLQMTNAQLTKVPVIDGLLKAMKKLTSTGESTDRGNATFELHPTLLRITTFEFISQSVAARGEGDVGFDGTLDLKLNAGPLERIQNALGKVGEILGSITDKLVSYRVTGTVDAPKYTVEPLGIKLKVPFIGKKEEQAGEASMPK